MKNIQRATLYASIFLLTAITFSNSNAMDKREKLQTLNDLIKEHRDLKKEHEKLERDLKEKHENLERDLKEKHENLKRDLEGLVRQTSSLQSSFNRSEIEKLERYLEELILKTSIEEARSSKEEIYSSMTSSLFCCILGFCAAIACPQPPFANLGFRAFFTEMFIIKRLLAKENNSNERLENLKKKLAEKKEN